MTTAITLEKVGLIYSDRPILQDVSLSLQEGEVLSLLGPPGQRLRPRSGRRPRLDRARTRPRHSMTHGDRLAVARELAAGKLAALFGRRASRDLFDVRELLRRGGLDRTKLRLGFVVYGGMNRRDWREVSFDDVQTNPDEVARLLAPMLRGDMAPDRDHIQTWTEQLVTDCKNLLSIVLPLEPREREFLDQLNDRGDITAALLTDDVRLQGLIRAHPALLWKALNVKRYSGASDTR